MRINPFALTIYVCVMCKTLSLEDCLKMQEQINNGIRPDTFNGMGLENLSLDVCKELIRVVVNSKKSEQDKLKISGI